MLQNSWSLKLSQPTKYITSALLPNPSFVFQGYSNQLLAYYKNQNITLPVRKQVKSLCNLPCQQGEDCQQILLLTPQSLLCFNFLNNQEKFALELQNANQMYLIDNMIYVICGQSLYCFDRNGQQIYVNHFTQSITSVCKRETIKVKTQAQIQTDNNHSFQLYIGFADMTLSRYVRQNLIYDFGKIVGIPKSMVSVGKGVVVGTKEGYLAYYETKKPKWKSKSSDPVLKVMKYLEDNKQYIVVLRQNGNLQLRSWQKKQKHCIIKSSQSAVNGFIMDFRGQKFDQIICVFQSGIIKAYNLIQTNPTNNSKPIQQDMVLKQNMIQSLQNQKAELQYQIEQIKERLINNKQQENQGPILDQNFTINGSLEYEDGLVLKVVTQNGYISGLTFEQPIMPVFVDRLQQLKYVFKEQNQVSGSITCQLLVHSAFSSTKYQIRNISVVLPKFWKWGLTSKIMGNIEGKLRFKMIERNARYLKWAKQCFLINISQKQQERLQSLSVMKLRFHNYYLKKDMQLIFVPNEGYVQIYCDCLKTMGDIVQDLVNYVGVKDLNTQLYLPAEKQRIKQHLRTVQKLSQNKISISAEMTEATNMIKFLLVKGQSARLVGSMNSFRKSYAEIMQQNRNLLTEIQKKNKNTKILGETMKQVGQFINKIANIRYGRPKTKIMTECRQAIKSKKFPEIIRLMDQGIDLDQ